jgi:succinate dehydrogenase / fumarate reductase cytochrome b subunit
MPARPLSPHLSVYRIMYTMALSILHRITGVILSIGLLLLAWWLMSVASGPAAYATAHSVMSGWFVKLLLIGWLAAFVYHLCNGIRHLTWDLGLGMEKHESRQSGRAMVIAAVVLFLALGYLAFFVQGGAR